MLQFKTLKLDPDLSFAVFRQTALLEEPTKARIAAVLKRDPRRIDVHLRALCELFALQKLDPHPSGTGKPIYLPLDVGIAGYLGASEIRRLHIFIMNERLAASSYSGEKRKLFYYYRSSGKKMIHLLEEGMNGGLRAFQAFESERIRKTDAELMRAFVAKNPGARGEVVAPVKERLRVQGVVFQPWEWLADGASS